MWIFNPPGASHRDGVWERKIETLKNAMATLLARAGSHNLSRDDLSTFFQEAASIVNNTPLWGVSSDPNDPCPLSPAMLMTMKSRDDPAGTFSYADLLAYGKRRWRRVQFLADCFWNRWRRSYLSNLTFRRKWKSPRKYEVGDIVLVQDRNTKRNRWPIGRI
ncbi:hypothetical protein FHG87_025302, partial [Trinorchestia longiramus]